MKKSVLLLSVVGLFALGSCKKKGCTDENAVNYDSEAEKDDGSCEDLVVPSTYVFTDANGNSTVSYGGQTARMDMLSEMTTYLKTANADGAGNPGSPLDATILLSMYDNSYTGWSDPSLVGNGKKLKNKTALGDAGVQAQFEAWMNEAAAATPPTDTSYYLQAETGQEWTQLIEKGLMSACFASQMTGNYLANIESDDNSVAVNSAEGKYYTEMEHHWDEAYGYFTEAVDYPTSGTDRFWGKYAYNTLETLLGSATKISQAFRTGRAAITAKLVDRAIAQKAIIQEETRKMVAGMAIHYLNKTKDYAAGNYTQNKVNHYLSEAWAFIYGIQFCADPDMSSTEVMGILVDGFSGYPSINADFEGFSNSPMSINAVIDIIANAAGLQDVKNDL